MDKKNISIEEIKKFSVTAGLLFIGLGLIFLLLKKSDQSHWLIFGGWIVIFWGYHLPASFRPVYYFWTAVGRFIGQMLTKSALVIFFYLILTPIGFLSRLFKNSPNFEPIDKNQKTYWTHRAQKSSMPEDYENQF